MAIPKNLVCVQGQTQLDDDFLNTLVQGCGTVAQLRTFTGLSNMTVMLLGQNAIGDGGGGIFYWQNATGFVDDGYNVVVPTGSLSGAWLRTAIQTQAYLASFSYLTANTPPGANQFVGIHVFTEAVTFPADLGGAHGFVENLPSAPVAVSIYHTGNLTPVGTMTVSTAGVFTFNTSGVALSFADGDAIVFQAPSASNGLNNFAWTIRGATAP